jgi:hypothetical protein
MISDDVRYYGEISGDDDDHRVVFSIPCTHGKGRILKAQTFTVPDSKDDIFVLSKYIAEDDTTLTLGVFDEDRVDYVAFEWLGSGIAPDFFAAALAEREETTNH